MTSYKCFNRAGWRSQVSRLVHAQKITGSNPVPAIMIDRNTTQTVMIVANTLERALVYADKHGYSRSDCASYPSCRGRVVDRVIVLGDLHDDLRHAIQPLKAMGTKFEAGFDQF
jgi:hypothetical protein